MTITAAIIQVTIADVATAVEILGPSATGGEIAADDMAEANLDPGIDRAIVQTLWDQEP